MSGGDHTDRASCHETCCPGEDCKDCTLNSGMEESGSSTCARCVLVESLRKRVEEMQEAVSRLCCVSEGEQEDKV